VTRVEQVGPQLEAYRLLKAYGHSPAKAAEIVLDASRGIASCKDWIEMARKSVTPPEPGK
jgi:hypothetical protein